MPLSEFTVRLTAIAEDQYTRFHLYGEGDPELCGQIKHYWSDLGFPPQSCTAVPWSAVFISWCVKLAGASSGEFKFASAHSKFVHAAIKNASNNTGVFRGFPIDIYKPQIGDIIQNNRNGNNFDFEFAKEHDSYESHSAIVIEVGQDNRGHYALTTGGNESNSVRQSIVRLDENGFIRQRPNSPYISIIQNLK